jgi:hypothetical protein
MVKPVVVVLLTPDCQSMSNIVHGPEPACIQALVAESSVEASTCPFCIGRPGWKCRGSLFEKQPHLMIELVWFLIKREVAAFFHEDKPCPGNLVS